jgi:hypothetical protein
MNDLATRETTELVLTAEELVNYTTAFFNETSVVLPATHHADLNTIHEAAQRFQTMLDTHAALPADEASLKQIRHDLKNILNLVVGYSQLLIREKRSPLTPLQYATVLSVYHTGKTLLVGVDALR